MARDGLRKPAALLAFAGVKPGDRVADLMPGEGYFTRLFSKVVGPRGRVYAIVPTELAKAMPKAVVMAKAVAADRAFANVSVLVLPTASVKAPQPLDVAWTSDNYHDVYAFFGPEQAQAFDKAVYAALKPGGVFVVIDHVGAPGLPPGLPPAVTPELWMKTPASDRSGDRQGADPGRRLSPGGRKQDSGQFPPTTISSRSSFPPSRAAPISFVFRFRKPG